MILTFGDGPQDAVIETERMRHDTCPNCQEESKYEITAEEHSACGESIMLLKALSICSELPLALGGPHDMIPKEGALVYPDGFDQPPNC